MVDAVLGGFAGAAASVVTSLVFVFDESTPAPAAVLAAGLFGGEPADHFRLGLASTFLYGVPGGAGYAAVLSVAGVEPSSLMAGVGGGTLYGVALFAVIRATLTWVDRPGGGYDRRLLLAHALYGASLGAWLLFGPTDPTATPGPAGM